MLHTQAIMERVKGDGIAQRPEQKPPTATPHSLPRSHPSPAAQLECQILAVGPQQPHTDGDQHRLLGGLPGGLGRVLQGGNKTISRIFM